MLVCQEAPLFTASAVLANGEITNEFSLAKIIQNQYGLLFFYPLDFTFVCPTELIALNKKINEFKQRKVEVIGISIDSVYTHKAWRDTPINKGGIGAIDFPLVADTTHAISKAYGVQHPAGGISLRGTFLIDNKGIIRSININDAPIGRSVDEILRLIDAVQFHEANGEVCPAGWAKGNVGMQASSEGVAAYLSEHSDTL